MTVGHDELAMDAAGDVPDGLDTTVHSSALEHVIEHIFLAEVLQEAWFSRGQVVDVLHSSVDAFGYDVALGLEGVTRHIQLKTRATSGKNTRLHINTGLSKHPSGCVVWMGWRRNEGTNRIELEYRWFGGEPGQPLPDLGNVVGKHTKGDSTGAKKERPNTRILNLGKFDRVADVGELLEKLFGPVGPGTPLG